MTETNQEEYKAAFISGFLDDKSKGTMPKGYESKREIKKEEIKPHHSFLISLGLAKVKKKDA